MIAGQKPASGTHIVVDVVCKSVSPVPRSKGRRVTDKRVPEEKIL